MLKHVFYQGSLFGTCDPAPDDAFASVSRTMLDDVSWVDFAPDWLAGADVVLAELLQRLELRQRTKVPMYDNLVDEPRLSAWWPDDGRSEPVLPVLSVMRDSLAARYGRRFDSIGFNLYRDGDDSVAWHGDRHRKVVTDPVVAIVSLGARRPLRMRPRGGGPSLSWGLGAGDLFVMGGACQHRWEHAVPKVRRAVGPRLSVTYRHDAR